MLMGRDCCVIQIIRFYPADLDSEPYGSINNAVTLALVVVTDGCIEHRGSPAAAAACADRPDTTELLTLMSLSC